jgi:hypothetical protein
MTGFPALSPTLSAALQNKLLFSYHKIQVAQLKFHAVHPAKRTGYLLILLIPLFDIDSKYCQPETIHL